MPTCGHTGKPRCHALYSTFMRNQMGDHSNPVATLCTAHQWAASEPIGLWGGATLSGLGQKTAYRAWALVPLILTEPAWAWSPSASANSAHASARASNPAGGQLSRVVRFM